MAWRTWKGLRTFRKREMGEARREESLRDKKSVHRWAMKFVVKATVGYVELQWSLCDHTILMKPPAKCTVLDRGLELQRHQLISIMSYSEISCKFILEPCLEHCSCPLQLYQGSVMPSPTPPLYQAVLSRIRYLGVTSNRVFFVFFFMGEGLCISVRISNQENK